jgi:hypothetical protein
MDKPNDIDYAIVDARLDGLNDMYVAAVHAYRAGIIAALCRFAREFAPSEVHAVRLAADVDWRWCFEAWLDEAGNEVEVDFGEDFYFEDLFAPGYLSELDDFDRATYGYVYVDTREFTATAPGEA